MRSFTAILLLAALGCSSDTVSQPTYRVVTYRFNIQGCVIVDSLRYHTGAATVTLAPPTLDGNNNWLHTQSIPAGGFMSADVWGLTCGTASAKVKATWTTPGYTSSSDSSFINVSGNFPFHLEITARHI